MEESESESEEEEDDEDEEEEELEDEEEEESESLPSSSSGAAAVAGAGAAAAAAAGVSEALDSALSFPDEPGAVVSPPVVFTFTSLSSAIVAKKKKLLFVCVMGIRYTDIVANHCSGRSFSHLPWTSLVAS